MTLIVVRFPENRESNFSLWKLNKATGVWESLTSSIQSNKRKRRQSDGYEIGEIDMTQVEFTDWFNVDEVVNLTDNVCYFRTRIYKDKDLTEEITGFSFYEMEFRRIIDNTLEIIWGDFPHYTCFAVPCDNNVGYVEVYDYDYYSYILGDLLYFLAEEPLMTRDPLTYNIVGEGNTIGIKMTASDFGPLYTDEAVCEASEIDKSHLRFRVHASPEVFTALEVSPIPTEDLPRSSPEFQEMQKKAWYPLRDGVFPTCFIKIKVDINMSDSSESTLEFFVASFGLEGLLSDTWNFLFGIRQFEVEIPSTGGFYCIEYKCSGILEDTEIVDYTQVRIELPLYSPYRCQVQHVKESLKKYPFGEDGSLKNFHWSSDWALTRYRSYLDIYAPTDYGGSYGVHGYTTNDLNDPENGRELARQNGHEVCMRSHVVHDGGAAAHLSCEVPNK